MTTKYPLAIARPFVLLPVIFIISVTSCKRTEQPNEELTQQTDTSAAPVATSGEPYAEAADVPPEKHEVIDYRDYWKAIQDPANAFEPFAKLKGIAADFIRRKDSLRAIGNDAFEKQEQVVYAAIMDYKRDVESGKYSQGAAVTLIDIPRTLGDKDSSSISLPEAQPSFFTNGNFFFLGGAPLIQRRIEYDTSTHQEIVFKDANGDPELRFQVTDTENRYHFLKSIMQFKKPRVKIDFGEPVGVYDGPPDEVKGIGSVKHNFIEDIVVYFLTESGIVPGRLKYYQEPFTEQYSCYSQYPYLIFSCSSDIDPDKIVGVLIPYDNNNPVDCSVTRPERWSWRADLNNDLVPDIACVMGTYDGVEDGVLEMLWFVNVNGSWKIVDYGEVPSCT
jgi:hypothetical protein